MREHHEDGALVCAVFSTYVFDNDWFLDTQDGFGHLFYPGPSTVNHLSPAAAHCIMTMKAPHLHIVLLHLHTS